jgi:hypothetical protein
MKEKNKGEKMKLPLEVVDEYWEVLDIVQVKFEKRVTKLKLELENADKFSGAEDEYWAWSDFGQLLENEECTSKKIYRMVEHLKIILEAKE